MITKNDFLILTSALCLSILFHAAQVFADREIPARYVFSTPRFAGGVGGEWASIKLYATEEQITSGDIHLRFNVRTQQLVSYKLPNVEIQQKCELHRVNGGSIGDYKPKGVRFWLMFGDAQLFHSGDFTSDYNENPVVRRYSMIRPTFTINEEARRILTGICANQVGTFRVAATWRTEGLCRWKPENWHKPETLPFQYDPAYDARIVRMIDIQCVR